MNYDSKKIPREELYKRSKPGNNVIGTIIDYVCQLDPKTIKGSIVTIQLVTDNSITDPFNTEHSFKFEKLSENINIDEFNKIVEEFNELGRKNKIKDSRNKGLS